MGSLLNGKLFELFKGHRLLVIAIIIGVILNCFIPLIHSFILLWTVNFAQAIAMSGIDIGMWCCVSIKVA